MRLLILDAERAYADNLRDRINAKCPLAGAISSCSLDDAAAKTDQMEHSPVLCLYNQYDFPDFPDRLETKGLLNKFTLWKIMPGNFPKPDALEDCYYRFSVKSILTAVEKWLLQMRCSSDTSPDTSEDDSQLATEFYLYFSLESYYSPQLVREKIKAKIKAGWRVIYLPLMPTYSMQLIACPDSGPGLSDLLLKLMGKNLQAEQLSHYWQPHPLGYYQFRPPDRSDDLVNCQPDILRSLVLLLQQFFQHNSQNSAVIIDCRGIPLANIKAVAVLCDHCDFTAPTGDSYALQAGQREINLLLSELPSTCHVNLRGQAKDKTTAKIQGQENVS